MARRHPNFGEIHPGVIMDVYVNARRRARREGMTFDLTRNEFQAMIAATSGRCSVSGIRFRRIPNIGRHMRQPFYPSIDRIDGALGYISGNCRIVCLAVNLAMNGWGTPVLLEVARAMVGMARGRTISSQ